MPSAYQLHGKTQYPWKSGDGVNNLSLNIDIPKPTNIPKGHALVRIKAVSLAARDLMVISHDTYPGPHKDDIIPCSDCAGIVEQIGEGNTDLKVGDRVLVNSASWFDWTFESGDDPADFVQLAAKGAWGTDGVLREYAVFPAEELIKAPSYLSFEELAEIPNAAGTAAHALVFGPRALKPGQTVLTQGTGGVSSLAILLGAAIGATVIATSSSDSKLAEAKKLGATHTINYTTHPDWDAKVLELTDGKGVDMVVEVGGSTTLERSVRATKLGGIISLVGFLGGGEKTDVVEGIIFGGKTLYGVRVFTRKHIEWAVGVLESKGLKPPVGRVFGWGLDEVKNAFRELVGAEGVGKPVVRVGGKE